LEREARRVTTRKRKLSLTIPREFLSFVLSLSLSRVSAQRVLLGRPQVAEGVKTAEVVIALAKKYNLILPVLTAVAQVVDGQLDAKEAVDTVMLFPQIEDVDEGYDFFKESEPSTTRRASSSCEQTSELTGV